MRDKETKKLDTTRLRLPFVNVIRPDAWVVTEKVDGSSTRIICSNKGIEIKGRTDRSEFSQKHLDGILSALPSHESVVEYFNLGDDQVVTFYGETFGGNIQRGQKYRETPYFAVFDIKRTNTTHNTDYYLSHDYVCGVTEMLGLYMVPVLGPVKTIPRTREELLDVIPYSKVAEFFRDVDDVEAEGIVAKPRTELMDQYGKRIQFKLTFRDL